MTQGNVTIVTSAQKKTFFPMITLITTQHEGLTCLGYSLVPHFLEWIGYGENTKVSTKVTLYVTLKPMYKKETTLA